MRLAPHSLSLGGASRKMIDIDDLAYFFECSPVVTPSDVPWEYAGVSLRFESGEDNLSCRMAPGEGELSLVWHQGSQKRLELSLNGYFDVKLESQSGRELLVAIPNQENLALFVLQLRPHVFVALGAVRQW